MGNDFFYNDATEKIRIIRDNNPEQIVDGVAIDNKKNTITIKDQKLENHDIYTVKVAVGDVIIHENQAGISEEYKVQSVDYKKRNEKFRNFPDQIDLIVSNIKNLKTENNINISGVTGSNIAIYSENINQNLNDIKKFAQDEEIKEKLIELERAIISKDKNKLQNILGFLMDKSFDLGIGLFLAKLTGQI